MAAREPFGDGSTGGGGGDDGREDDDSGDRPRLGEINEKIEEGEIDDPTTDRDETRDRDDRDDDDDDSGSPTSPSRDRDPRGSGGPSPTPEPPELNPPEPDQKAGTSDLAESNPARSLVEQEEFNRSARFEETVSRANTTTPRGLLEQSEFNRARTAREQLSTDTNPARSLADQTETRRAPNVSGGDARLFNEVREQAREEEQSGVDFSEALDDPVGFLRGAGPRREERFVSDVTGGVSDVGADLQEEFRAQVTPGEEPITQDDVARGSQDFISERRDEIGSAAALGVAAPEPASTAAGAATLGLLGVAAAADRAEIETPDDPFEGDSELDAPAEDVGPTPELVVPEGQTTVSPSELGLPDDIGSDTSELDVVIDGPGSLTEGGDIRVPLEATQVAAGTRLDEEEEDEEEGEDDEEEEEQERESLEEFLERASPDETVVIGVESGADAEADSEAESSEETTDSLTRFIEGQGDEAADEEAAADGDDDVARQVEEEFVGSERGDESIFEGGEFVTFGEESEATAQERQAVGPSDDALFGTVAATPDPIGDLFGGLDDEQTAADAVPDFDAEATQASGSLAESTSAADVFAGDFAGPDTDTALDEFLGTDSAQAPQQAPRLRLDDVLVPDRAQGDQFAEPTSTPSLFEEPPQFERPPATSTPSRPPNTPQRPPRLFDDEPPQDDGDDLDDLLGARDIEAELDAELDDEFGSVGEGVFDDLL